MKRYECEASASPDYRRRVTIREAHTEREAAEQCIGDRRPGYTTLAALLAGYACNKAVAMRCRLDGDITGASIYETHCDLSYERIPQDLR